MVMLTATLPKSRAAMRAVDATAAAQPVHGPLQRLVGVLLPYPCARQLLKDAHSLSSRLVRARGQLIKGAHSLDSKGLCVQGRGGGELGAPKGMCAHGHARHATV